MTPRPSPRYVEGVSIPRHILTAAAALLASALAPAQGATAWAERSFHGGVAANAVTGQGKLVTYDAGAELHIFSSMTRSWRSVEKSAMATVRLFNDIVLVIDHDRIVATSAYFGEPTKQSVSGPSSLWNSSGAKNDSIIVIQDGGLLHAFSAFTSTWTTLAVAANASGSVQRHVAVVASDQQLFGMSAFEGAWHATDASAPSSLSSDGTAAFAVGADVQAFSAHTRRWSHATPPTNALFGRGHDWGAWLGPNSGLAYSGLTGSFAEVPLPGASVIASSDLYALFESGATLHAYSAVTGDLVTVGPPAAAVDIGLGTALLHSSAGVRGYSALRQQVQPLATTPASSGAGAACAHVVDAGGEVYGFSALTGTWQAAPPGTAGLLPLTTTTTIALATASDCFAFSPMTGQFHALGAPVDGLAGNLSSAPLLAYDAVEMHAFDTEQARWISTQRTGVGAPIFRIWRTAALALDGPSAHAFGAQAGAWHRFDHSASVSASFANSEVGYLVDAQRIIACSMLPEIVGLQQFPHFRRVQPRAAEVAFMTAPLGDAVVVAGFAPGASPTPIVGLGELHLNLADATTVWIGASASGHHRQIRWTPPSAAALAGVSLFAQLLVMPTNGGLPYLSDRATVQPW